MEVPTLLIFLVVAVSYCYAQESSGDHVTTTDDNNGQCNEVCQIADCNKPNAATLCPEQCGPIFLKESNKFCHDTYETNIDNFDTAKYECLKNIECLAIGSTGCEDSGYYLCKEESQIKVSSRGSCIYRKQATPAEATTAAATTQAATTAAATTAAVCIDTDYGLTDLDGSGCSSYTTRPSDCGEYDFIQFDTDDEWDRNFFANQMCCACGGGTSGK